MGKDFSFDIISEIDMQEINNATDQTMKEVLQRYDFKGSKTEVDFKQDEKKLILISDDEMKLRALRDILSTKLAKRGISLKAIKYGKEEGSLGGRMKQEADLVFGIAQEYSKKIIKIIKDLKLKVQPTIQGDQVRVSSNKKDELQVVIQRLKESEIDIPLQFTNYR